MLKKKYGSEIMVNVKFGSKDNLHFDHIIPFSKGGSSLVAVNIQLLCARHNLKKRDKIE
jgi:5-methylcytosine-specific restriction endonuclease McrA